MLKRLVCWTVFLWVCAGLCILIPLDASAQTTGGVRAGVSVDPDQFYFGGHVETPPLVDEIRFRPNVEIGIGSDLTVVAANLEFTYRFPSQRDWYVYAGSGPALTFVDTEDDTDAGGGLNILIGVEHSGGLFAEFKVGILDSPRVKFGVGYSFR
jgi:hypothetical protein